MQLEHDVEDFLITDRELALQLDTSAGARESKEKLLVYQDGEELRLALYLDAATVAHLAQDDPTRLLHEGNLADFLLALEGVSHFLYLAWNATRRRPVSLLELELQAEVDKYITTLLLFSRQRPGSVPAALHTRLFDQTRFDAALCGEYLQRYRRAHRYAAKYCLTLQRKLLSGRRRSGALHQLRAFYRMPQRDKLRCIDGNG